MTLPSCNPAPPIVVTPPVIGVPVGGPVVGQPVGGGPVGGAPQQPPAADRPEVIAGSVLSLQGNGLGADVGMVIIQIGSITLSGDIQEWQDALVTVQLPRMGVLEPTDATLFVVRADGSLADQAEISLVQGEQEVAAQ